MTLYILLIVWLVTVALIPVTVRLFQEQNELDSIINMDYIIKVLFAIPLLGTALMVIFYFLEVYENIEFFLLKRQLRKVLTKMKKGKPQELVNDIDEIIKEL